MNKYIKKTSCSIKKNYSKIRKKLQASPIFQKTLIRLSQLEFFKEV